MSKLTQNSHQQVKLELRLSLMDQKAQKPPKVYLQCIKLETHVIRKYKLFLRH